VGRFHGLSALAAGICALTIQIGTNLANDVFDFKKGADHEGRLGPTRVVQAGLLSPRRVLRGMLLFFSLAALSGLYLAFHAGPIILLLGILSIASGILYTGGPFPLGYHGLGDLFVMIFFGFVAVCGTAFVQAGFVPGLAWISALAVGAMATAILVVNNVRDRQTDAQAGKRTLAVRLGKRGAVLEYLFLFAIAYAAPMVMAAKTASGWPLLPLLTLPGAIFLIRDLWQHEGKPLNRTLASTAQLMLGHGLLLSLGLCLQRISG
jgi:1,4-dihydroxy-2-naphthoate octaprenyltransferase